MLIGWRWRWGGHGPSRFGQFLVEKDRDTYSNRAATYTLIEQSSLAKMMQLYIRLYIWYIGLCLDSFVTTYSATSIRIFQNMKFFNLYRLLWFLYWYFVAK